MTNSSSQVEPNYLPSFETGKHLRASDLNQLVKCAETLELRIAALEGLNFEPEKLLFPRFNSVDTLDTNKLNDLMECINSLNLRVAKLESPQNLQTIATNEVTVHSPQSKMSQLHPCGVC